MSVAGSPPSGRTTPSPLLRASPSPARVPASISSTTPQPPRTSLTPVVRSSPSPPSALSVSNEAPKVGRLPVGRATVSNINGRFVRHPFLCLPRCSLHLSTNHSTFLCGELFIVGICIATTTSTLIINVCNEKPYLPIIIICTVSIGTHY
jgi:hypothetical protein